MLLPHRFRRLTIVLTVSAATAGCGGGEDVTEPPATGTLEITTSTSGAEQDADGYSVQIDAQAPRAIGAAATLTVPGVTPGNHTVKLGDLAANCTVAGDNPRAVSVTAGETATVSFVVSCAPTTGSIQVTTATTGSSLDPDGYTVSLDAGASQVIGVNATLTLEDIALGTHTLTLSGIAGNCHLDGENPRAVEVSPGSTNVTFDLNCLGADALIAFTSNAVRLLAIFVVNPDGTEIRNLTPEGASESDPTWSPDGRKILFSKSDDLYVMDADGSGRVKLADGQGIFEHRWSPDGRMIAYVNTRQVGEDFFDDLWVMQSDGTEKVMVAEQAYSISWSPDGRIVYTSLADLGDVHLRIIHADGSRDVRLTDRAAFQPAWSPDGTRIAFVTLGVIHEIFLINPDGSGEANLTQGLGHDDGPTWSPDGGRIAFTTAPLGPSLESEIAVMNRDGTSRMNLTNRPGFDISPDWSPDGSKIVYDRSEGGDSEIYVMSADGTGQTNVSNRPDSYESTPDWNGQGPTAVASRSAAYNSWLRAHGLEASRLHR